jgi:uncharacterized protein YidB (DUF937 family)
LRTTAADGVQAPEGIRKIVQQVTETAGAEGIAQRLAASSGAEMREIITDITEIKENYPGLINHLSDQGNQLLYKKIIDVISN